MSIAIKVENLSKAYQLGEIGTGTLSNDLKRWAYKVRGKEDPFLKIGETNDRTTKGESDMVWSLKDLNFEIEQGDAVGIIGRNGAGKSTLLKILSRVTSPTTGSVKVKGRVASLLEVGTGFHPELTGRENIFLNGAILGMRKAEIKKHFDAIVDFAGVERYIDTPVKRYSSGMYVRLAFAVAAHLESEILIVDEVLAVGDAEFQKKCLGKMNDVSKGEGRTILFVSHNMGNIKELCNTGILLMNGQIANHNKIDYVIDSYKVSTSSTSSSWVNGSESKMPLHINSINIKDIRLKPSSLFTTEEDIIIEVETTSFENLKNSTIAINIHSGDGVHLLSMEDVNVYPSLRDFRQTGNYITILTIPKKTLNKGVYLVRVGTGIIQTQNFMNINELCFEVINEKAATNNSNHIRGYLYPKFNLTYNFNQLI